jgi:hypothetical protein
MTFNGTKVHVCPGGALLIGVDATNNRFLCSNVFLLDLPAMSDLTVEVSTYATFRCGILNTEHSVHVCPANSAMIGWHKGKDWLICMQLFQSGLVPLSSVASNVEKFGTVHVDGPSGTEVPEPNHANIMMHACDSKARAASCWP